MIWVHEEYYCTSVDRRNLPPVDMQNIPFFIGFHS